MSWLSLDTLCGDILPWLKREGRQLPPPVELDSPDTPWLMLTGKVTPRALSHVSALSHSATSHRQTHTCLKPHVWSHPTTPRDAVQFVYIGQLKKHFVSSWIVSCWKKQKFETHGMDTWEERAWVGVFWGMSDSTERLGQNNPHRQAGKTGTRGTSNCTTIKKDLSELKRSGLAPKHLQ